MHPDDIAQLVTVGSPAVSPDGATVAFVVTTLDLERNDYRSAIWMAPADGSARPTRFTAGEQRDENPCWAPDGHRLAFTSKREAGNDKHSTLHLAPVTVGGEVVTLTTRNEAIGALSWSPDGNYLAYSSRVREERYESDDPKRQPPRRIERLRSKLNAEGFISDRPRHIFVVAADGLASPVQLTDGPFEHDSPSWSPDSRQIVFSGARHENFDLEPADDLFVVDRRGGELRRVTDTTLSFTYPSWSPQGTSIATLVGPARSYPRNHQVEVVDVASGERRLLTEKLERTCAPYPGVRAPVWDGNAIVFSVEDRGNVHVYRVGADGSAPPELVVGGERQVTGYDVRAGTLAFTATTPTTLAELFVANGEERRLTRLTDAFHERVSSLPTQRFVAPTDDGEEVDAWIVRPADFDASARYPLLLTIHGGPWTQFGNKWFDEVQLYASAGYVVVYANPRGSSGRHDAWGRAIRGPITDDDPGTGWGGVDYTDLLAVVDTAIARYPFVDPDRLGVLGGSYGGYMTSWMIGHDHRFKAALSERAVNNLLSLEWTSDIAGFFRFEFGTDQLEHPEEYIRMSPITYARDIATPVLIVHSEDDLRCPIEQGEQLFIALRMMGKPVEFVRFPGENHELSRSGSPIHRIQRANIVLEWFDRHLKPAAPSAHQPSKRASKGTKPRKVAP